MEEVKWKREDLINVDGIDGVKKKKLVKKVIRKRKKNKKKKRLTLFSLGLITLLLMYFFLPIFRINSYSIVNQFHANRNLIEITANDLLGQHMHLYNKKTLKMLESKDPYIKEILLSQELGKPLIIDVKERSRDYILDTPEGSLFMDRTGKVLQLSREKEDKALKLIDDTPIMAPGNTMYMEGDKKTFLLELKDLLDKNISKINFSRVDITDSQNIKLYSGNWEVLIGDGKRLKEKLNNSVNILTAMKKGEKGQIDVKYESSPIIRKAR